MPRRNERIVYEAHSAISSTVTDAIYEAGYNSNGRFYEVSNEVLGMTPSSYRSGGARTEIRFAVGECSLGSILVAKSERGVCAILLGTIRTLLARDLQDRFPEANLIGGDAEFEQLVAKVVGFVEAPASGLDLPLDVRGTAFPAARVANFTEDSSGLDGYLYRYCRAHRFTESRARSRPGMRRKRSGGRYPLPSRRPQLTAHCGLSLGRRTQTRAARTGSAALAKRKGQS